MLRLGDTVSRAMLLDPMNLIRSVLFVLLMACSAIAQITLPAGTLPSFDTAGSSLVAAKPDPKFLDCGSTVEVSVRFTDRVYLMHSVSWPPAPDWWQWPDQQEYLDDLAREALFADPVALLQYLARWEARAEVMAARDHACHPCPRENATECAISVSAVAVMPIPDADVQVLSVVPFSGGVLISVDFTLTYDAWVTCDTKEGCR